jgi:hypothetical protein
MTNRAVILFFSVFLLGTSSHLVKANECVKNILQSERGPFEGKGKLTNLDVSGQYFKVSVKHQTEIVEDILGSWLILHEVEKENFERRFISSAFRFDSVTNEVDFEMTGAIHDTSKIHVVACDDKSFTLEVISKDWLTLQTTTLNLHFSKEVAGRHPKIHYSFWRSSVNGRERGPLIEELYLE